MNQNTNRAAQPHDEHSIPSSRELTRFLERRRAQEFGYELPLSTREAANYIGLHPKTLESMARKGDVPAHPISGVRRKTWRYFPSELDAWLLGRLNSLSLKTQRPGSIQ